MFTPKEKYVKILDFREGNEESFEEARAEKARVYAEFDDCTRTENLVEILRFTHFSKVFRFSKIGNYERKKDIFHEIKVSNKNDEKPLVFTSIDVIAGGF